MSPPLPKDYDWVQTFLTSSAKKLKESPEKYNKLFESYECKALLDCDMSSEVKWLLELIPTFESPIVFSHNDFRFANQMITDNNEVVLGDFEFSSFYYRGFDFATLFDNTDPNEEIIKEFITQYVREGNRIFGKIYSENAINSVDNILKETKQLSMVYSLFISNTLLHNDIWQTPINEKTCMVSHYTGCTKMKLVSIVRFWWTHITLLKFLGTANRQLSIYHRGYQNKLKDIKINSVGIIVKPLEGVKV